MTDNRKTNYRSLREDEIRQLMAQSCTADDWSAVQVTEPFLAERVRATDFDGKVSLGSLAGEIQRAGPKKPCGIYNARLQDCVIGVGVRIANVGSHIAGYHIGNDVLIENIGVMEARQVASNTGSDYERFLAAGLDVRLDGNPNNMHHKVLIIDEQVVVTGSYNFSLNAETRNDENSLVIFDPEVADLYLEEFRRVFAAGQD